ncbi:hypothetical protein XmelCFBP4644_10245 [Xanthomonas melonis]|uniref:Uncharacterized protein n=1 Tax=Xanthomonas melonis TaxID=56456 RepID=A0A2S7DGX2_9XANT|nr:hypothetical protein XmelCFBP4644_10245 [Xanthomonas melonis]
MQDLPMRDRLASAECKFLLQSMSFLRQACKFFTRAYLHRDINQLQPAHGAHARIFDYLILHFAIDCLPT